MKYTATILNSLTHNALNERYNHLKNEVIPAYLDEFEKKCVEAAKDRKFSFTSKEILWCETDFRADEKNLLEYAFQKFFDERGFTSYLFRANNYSFQIMASWFDGELEGK